MTDQVTVSRKLLHRAIEALRWLLPDTKDDNHDGHDARDVRQWRQTESALRAALEQPAVEAYGHVTVRRLSQRFENHVDQYQFYPAGQIPYTDNVDECIAVYAKTQAQQEKP